MDIGMMDMTTGDKLIFSDGGGRRVWVISAVNNQVVKYFDENGRYGQMPLGHLAEMAKNHQIIIEKAHQGGSCYE